MTAPLFDNDPLRKELIALAEILSPKEVVLTVGGGYGLVLRTEHVIISGARTRFPETPYTRSTNDVDCFLTADLISDATKTKLIREALVELQYKPIESAKYFQFAKTLKYKGIDLPVKFDFLAARVDDPLVKVDTRRIRPKDYALFHARVTEEALTLSEYRTRMNIGTEYRPAEIYLPHPFTYLLLKLHAFGDQVGDEQRDFGRHHAFDLYATIALVTEKEWNQIPELREKYKASPVIARAREVCAQLFASSTSLGLVRLREFAGMEKIPIPLDRIEEFVSDLTAIFSEV